MAELKPGILGTISGKVGTVVAASWRDISYLRGLPVSKNRKARETVTQRRLVVLSEFLSTISPLAEEGFKHQCTKRATPLNFATKANMRAFKGDTAELDPGLITISAGGLTGIIEPEVSFAPSGDMLISWVDLGDSNNQSPSDKASILLYSPAKEEAEISAGIVRRGDLKARIAFPESFRGGELHVYIYFSDPAGHRNSASNYLGCFMTPVAG